MKYFPLLFLCCFTLSCQLTPTKVFEQSPKQINVYRKAQSQKLEITKHTVVIDARSRFDYGMAHLAQSVNVWWEDFSQKNGRFPGKLRTDFDKMAKRLALLGVTPDSHVVIIGYGPNGKGEEGRLAWTLYSLGVQKIQFASAEFFKIGWSNSNFSKPQPNAKAWDPKLNFAVDTTRREALQIIRNKKLGTRRAHVIDVRSEDEFFSDTRMGGGYGSPEVKSIHIHWKEFFTRLGKPNPKIARKLKAIGLKESDAIVFISNKGLRSAAATMALLSLGFDYSRNFSGGYLELFDKK